MPDWITLLIESVGVVILCIWIVVPIQEFKIIFKQLRREGHPTLTDPTGHPAEPTADHDSGHPNSGEDA